MDSKLVVEQMSGRWQIKHPGLRPLAAQAASLVARFESVRFTWVPRDQNVAADALANAAMDAAGAGGVAPSAAETFRGGGAESAGGAAPVRWEPPSEEGAARLILVRHGSTSLTAERRYSGRGDVALTPAGEAQSRAVASRLATMVMIALLVRISAGPWEPRRGGAT